jgi:hypothetical protein
MNASIWLLWRLPLACLVLVQIFFFLAWALLLPWYVTASVLLLLLVSLGARRRSSEDSTNAGVWARWWAAPQRYPLAFFLVLPALTALLMEGAFSLLTFIGWTLLFASQEWPPKDQLTPISAPSAPPQEVGSEDTGEISVLPFLKLRLAKTTSLAPAAPTIYAMPEEASRSLYWALQSVEWVCLACATVGFIWLGYKQHQPLIWIILPVFALSLAGGYRTFGLELVEINGTMSPRSGPRLCDPPDWLDMMAPWAVAAAAWAWFRSRKSKGTASPSMPSAATA